jgi:hypothetical protein
MNPKLQLAKGKYDKHLLKNGDWYGEEDVQGSRGLISCTPAGFFINEQYLYPPVNSCIGLELDGVLEPNGTITLFDCLSFHGQSLKNLPLVRRRRVLQRVIEEWNWEKIRMVPNTALLGITMAEMINRGPTILKNLRALYGDPEAWVKVSV